MPLDEEAMESKLISHSEYNGNLGSTPVVVTPNESRTESETGPEATSTSSEDKVQPIAGSGVAAGGAAGANGAGAGGGGAAAAGGGEANTELRKAAAALTSNRHSNESGTTHTPSTTIAVVAPPNCWPYYQFHSLNSAVHTLLLIPNFPFASPLV